MSADQKVTFGPDNDTPRMRSMQGISRELRLPGEAGILP